MGDLWAQVKAAPLTGKVGLAVILLNLFAVLAAPLIAPYGETEVVGRTWQLPQWFPATQDGHVFLLGTDHLGRDIFSRMIYGARNTITIAIVTTLLSFLIGMTGGFLSATARGWVDQLLSRLVDVLMGFPALIFALLVLSVVGTSIPAMVAVIATIEATRVYRVSRAVAMDIEALDFVEAAKIRGEGTWWIVSHELVPNAIAPLLAEFGLRFCYVFLFISSLGFLGLGVQPPAAEWGSMLRENAAAISFGIMIPLFPAAAVMLLAVSVNLVVDWILRQTSDVRQVVALQRTNA
jgi:peptide/nickel transport system permease protein